MRHKLILVLACMVVVIGALASASRAALAGTDVQGDNGKIHATDDMQTSGRSASMARSQEQVSPQSPAVIGVSSAPPGLGGEPVAGSEAVGAPLDPSAAVVTSPGLPFTIGGQCINVTITYVAIPGGVPGCAPAPAAPAAPGGVGVPAAPRLPPPPSAAQVVQRWSQDAVLPAPRLVVAPGDAVTGLTAYLEIHSPDPWAVAIADPIRHDAIAISCGHVGFDVDWGDQGAPTHTTSAGGPYPNGDVTHAYQWASPDDTLAVTEHWSCAWGDPLGDAGTLNGLVSAAQLPLEVREIQAINVG